MRKVSEYMLRPYQEECKDAIEKSTQGHHLAVLATGLGKTVVFTHLTGMGRTLILSHRDELVRQPEKYYEGRCTYGVEKADEHASDEDVVSASVQSLCRDNRLSRYTSDAFSTIIVDEAHHAAAPTYKKILKHFSGATRVIGFTATPKRGDGVRLTDVFDDIIFSRDLRWGITNQYLSRIRCRQVSAHYDLKKISKVAGDYSVTQLAAELENSDCIPVAAKAYVETCHTNGRHTLIYCVTRKFCQVLLQTIRNLLPKEERETIQMVDGTTPDEERRSILADFASGKVRCIVNCMVLTEGTDLPICDAVINLRPTCNDTLYQQMAGRGTRLYDGKEYCLLIDVIPENEGVDHSLCTAPTLFGIDPARLSAKERKRLNEDTDLLSYCDQLSAAFADTAKSIELKIETINQFVEEREGLLRECEGKSVTDLANAYSQFQDLRMAESGNYDFGDLDVKVQADETRYYKITPNWNDAIYIAKPDVLDQTTITFQIATSDAGKPFVIQGNLKMDEAIELARMYCELGAEWFRYSWNKNDQKVWKSLRATEKQEGKIEKEYRKTKIDSENSGKLSKLDASRLIDMALQLKEAKHKAEILELSLSTKKTKKVQEAKAQAEKMQKQELSIETDPKAFQAFCENTKRRYESILKRRKQEEERIASIKKAGTISVAPTQFPEWHRTPTESQIAFAGMLMEQAVQLGCRFPGLKMNNLTKREMSILIGLLLEIKKQAVTCDREFSGVYEICHRSEEKAACTVCIFNFPYKPIKQNDAP